MGPSLGFVTDVFFVVVELWKLLWSVLQSERTPEPLFYVIGYCSVKELRHVEVEFASPLVGVHRVTFARVSEQNQEKRSLGGK